MPTSNTNNATSVPVVEEINGYVTVSLAASLMEIAVNSVAANVHSGKVKAVRIAGIFLIEKASAIEFGKRREVQAQAERDRKTRQDRLATLAGLSDEQLSKLLAHVESGE